MPNSEYLTKQIAASRLAISERRLLDLAARGVIARKYITDNRSGQQMSVFATRDLERYEKEHPRSLAPSSASSLHTRPMQIVRRLPTPPPPPRLPLFVTLPQAAEWIGLPVGYLRRQIRSGQLPAIDVGRHAPGGRWRISRRDLSRMQGTICGE